MADNLKLPYGCNQGVPDNVEVAWGARWIVQGGGYMDQLGDRMGTGVRDDVPAEDAERMKGELFAYLNDVVKMQPRENARHLHILGKLSDRDEWDTVVVIYDDPKCKVVASLQKSYGYCYVAAWLKDHVIQEEAQGGEVQWANMDDPQVAQDCDDTDAYDEMTGFLERGGPTSA